MNRQDEPLETLERRWRAASSLIFKEDVGSLSQYLPWLLENTEPLIHRNSSLSGKPITYVIPEYAENSKWADFNEMSTGRKFEPLDLNELKDTDSLREALSDRVCYVGNVVLGNSRFVQRSSNINDSFHVYESGRFGDSKYICCCAVGRFGEDCFGCNGIGESSFCIKCSETYREKRIFEVWFSQNTSDCYYSYGLNNCSECMFCFHLKNKRHAIGNLELGQSKYGQIKKKLLSEMADELRRNKRLPSLVEIVQRSKIELPVLPKTQEESQLTNKKPMEEAFSKACQLIIGGAPPGSIDLYADWLRRHVQRKEECASAVSGKALHRGDYCNCFALPRDRLITNWEAQLLGEHAKLSEGDLENLSFSNIGPRLGKIAFFSPGYFEGTSANMIEDPVYISSSNCYKTLGACYSKYCAYSFWPRNSHYAFGCANLFESDFCINCYYSVKLTRCFETDSSRDCADCYFCHNCENLRDCMFCFNMKNRRYAIGNVEVGRERFMEVKERFLKEICENLAKDKTLGLDIFNLGSQAPH